MTLRREASGEELRGKANFVLVCKNDSELDLMMNELSILGFDSDCLEEDSESGRPCVTFFMDSNPIVIKDFKECYKDSKKAINS